MKTRLFIILIIFWFTSCKKATVIDIYSFSFPNTIETFFGENSDVLISGLQDSSVSIKCINSDSAFLFLRVPIYYKINDTTQNTVPLDSISFLQFNNDTVQFQSLKNIIDKFKNSTFVTYIRLADLVKLVYPSKHLDYAFANTVIANRSQDYKLIILDSQLSATRFDGFRYKPLLQQKISLNSCTLQFFKTYNSSIVKVANNDDRYFSNKDTTYFTRVKSLFTTFGANQLYISDDKNKLKVEFNKPCRIVIPTSVIEKSLEKNSNVSIDVKQQSQITNYGNDVYVFNFSQSYCPLLGSFDSLKNFNKSPYLTDIDIKKAQFNFWQLCLVGCVIAMGFYLLFTCIKNNNSYLFEIYPQTNEAKNWKKYYLILFSVVSFLMLGRLYISYNLSYTYPYFDFTGKSNFLIAPLILIGVYSGWFSILLLNYGKDVLSKKDKLKIIISSSLLIVIAFVISYITQTNFTNSFFSVISKAVFLNFDQIPVYHLTIVVLLLLDLFFIGLITFTLYRDISGKLRNWIVFPFFLIGASAFLIINKNSYTVALFLCFVCLYISISNLNKRLGLAIERNEIFLIRFFLFLLFLIANVLILGVFVYKAHDPGYVIECMLFFFLLWYILSVLYSYHGGKNENFQSARVKQDYKRSITLFLIVTLIGFFTVRHITSVYDAVDDDRFYSRVTAFYDFNKVQNAGLKTSESEVQFFSILATYSLPENSRNTTRIHPGISSFSDPIVKNDLSVPVGLIYPFGTGWWWVPVVALILLWLFLLYLVLKQSFFPRGREFLKSSNQNSKTLYFTSFGLIRLYCASVIVGSGLWLILSYYGVVPFTGRLIYGLGQDSLAEAIMTVFLFVFMGLVV